MTSRVLHVRKRRKSIRTLIVSVPIGTYLERVWSSENVISSSRAVLKWIEEWIKNHTWKTLRKGDHAVPDIKEKLLVEPLQSGSQAHVQYTGSHVTLYTVFLRRYWRLDTLVIMYSWYWI